MCLPLKLTAILQLIIGPLNLHAAQQLRENSREADCQRLALRMPTLQMLDVVVFIGEIKINAGNRIYSVEKMPE